MQSLRDEPSASGVNAAFVDDFLRLVDEAAARMLTMEDQDAARPGAAGKWSRKEVVGHLIDSAINNHARFVRAVLQDDLVFDGYDQDAWVRAQRYQERSWPDLVRAWRTYNRQLADIVSGIAPQDLARPRPRHNLHEIAFRSLAADAGVTLGTLIEDYVAHMQHHLRQVLETDEASRAAAPESVGVHD